MHDEYFSVAGLVLPCSDGCYQMVVELEPVVPEPSSLGLGVAGLLAAVLVSVFRRRLLPAAVHQCPHYDSA